MVFLPKVIPTGLSEVFSAEVEALRPLTLTDTGSKVLALTANRRLSELATTTVVAQQRGLVPGRSLGDKLYELEAAMLSYSGMRQRSAAAILVDFRTAFPALSRRWLLKVLRAMGMPLGMVRVVEQLYINCECMLVFSGEVVGTMAITSGIKQGCPMSGSLFALAVDPFLRCILVTSVVGLLRLEAYADDLAIVMSKFWEDVRAIMEQFHRWRLASALALNERKCVMAPLWPFIASDISERLAVDCPPLSGCVVSGSARYLGVEVGPDAHSVQWVTVFQKLLRRTADIVAGGESLGVRLRRFTVYASSLPAFRGQFVDVDASVCHVWAKCLQCLTSAPWHSIAGPILRGLRPLGFSVAAEDLQHVTDACRLRHVFASAVFDVCVAEVSAAGLHEDALLAHPYRHWVENGILGSTARLRQRAAAVQGVPEALASSALQARLLRIFLGPAASGAALPAGIA